MQKRRVLIFVHDILNRAGIQRAVVNLSNILDKLGYVVCIASIQSTEGEVPYALSPSVEVRHLGIVPKKRNKFQMHIFRYQFFFRIRKVVINYKADIVFGTTYFVSHMLGYLPKKIKKIGCEHFCWEIAKDSEKQGKRKHYKKLDAVVLLTERDRKEYTFLNNTSVIPNSFSFIPQTTSDCLNKKIISLGRFSFQKGFSFLIEAIKLIENKLDGWIVELYGYGEQKESLLNQINKLGLSGIIKIKDSVSDVESVYNSASIFLSTSQYEGLPMVLIEAQTCGVPAVVFDCPCGPSDIVINGKTGYVVPLNDVQKFSEKVLELVETTQLRIEMGRNAKIESSRYSEEKISVLWKSLLDSLF